MPQTEDLGIAYVHSQVAKMGFFFREQSKHDFGVDSHIETADANGLATGRNIAVQIKSGASYIKQNEKGDLVHYTDEKHILYWAQHSLPVILIIFDPQTETAWWCDVKAYISRHPTLLSHGPYKIECASTSQFNVLVREELRALEKTYQGPLTLSRELFSIISIADVSTNQAKRYRSEILLGNASQNVARLAIYQATNYLKTVVEHSSEQFAVRWVQQQPHVIWLYVYRTLEDKAHTNWMARSVWHYKNNEGAKLIHFGKGNDFTNDIEIEFSDDRTQQARSEFVAARISSKYDFTKKVTHWISLVDELVNQAQKLSEQIQAQQITLEFYVDTMSNLSRMYIETIENKFDNGTSAPLEARDAELKFVQIIGDVGNLFLLFSPRGLQTWTDLKQRDWLFQSYLKRYYTDREMFAFEIKKLNGR